MKKSNYGYAGLKVLLLLMCVPMGLWAQLRVTLVDAQRHPVVDATVVLLRADSTCAGAALSAPDGLFAFSEVPTHGRLIIQHLQYQTLQLPTDVAVPDTLQLELKGRSLDEVVVKAERPLVQVADGKLCYRLPSLVERQAVSNVYEALAKVPGVWQDGSGQLSLAGAGSLTLMLDGRPTTMSAEQLQTLLRSMSVNQVERVEVMYSAPPELHVRGAVLNVVTKRPPRQSFQGEVGADYKNQYFNSGGAHANFRFSSPRTTVDVMYSANCVKNLEYTELSALHTLPEGVYDIRQDERLSSRYWAHQVRGSLDYQLRPKSSISVAYTGSFVPDGDNLSLAHGNFQQSDLHKQMQSAMHNVALRYEAPFGLKVGGDFTRYTADNDQLMQVDWTDGRTSSSYTLTGGQRISSYSLYADQQHRLGPKQWTLGYGASYRWVSDHDFQTYQLVSGEFDTENTESRRHEHTADVYVSLGRQWATGPSFSVSVTGEYYRLGHYRKWSVFPQASLTYMKNPKHIFQLSLSTDKTYPSYWAMQSFVTYLNGYSELQGSPGLRPMTSYSLSGMYIWKQKYIFGLFYTHVTDYFAQVPYQATDRLALIYKQINWNYMRTAGANVIVPYSLGKWYESRLTLVGMQARQKCDHFFDLPFNRSKWMFVGVWDNTFKVGRHLSFELVGNWQTPFIQGTFDLATSFNLTAGMKWNFAHDRCSLTARCSDIFNRSMPSMKVRFNGQHLDMNPGFYTRAVTLNFIYRFGGYKQKETKGVDMSRFGH